MIARHGPPNASLAERPQRLAGVLLIVLILLIAVAGPRLTPSATAATTYTLIDLGVLPNNSTSQATAINASGEVAGTSAIVQNNSTTSPHAFRWQGNQMTDLGLVNNSTFGAGGVNAIGVGGDVVGVRTTNAGTHAFVASGTTVTDLNSLFGNTYSNAYGINDAGTIVGEAGSFNFTARPWSLTGQTVTQLPLPSGATIGTARDINAAGTIVGATGTYDGANGRYAYKATIWQDGGVTTLPNLAGKSYSVATGVNASGLVVGYSYTNGGRDTRAVLWQNGTAISIADFDFTGAHDINASGQIVLTAFLKAYLYQDGTLTEINTLMPSGCGMSGAYAINDNGQIVGVGSCANSGQSHAFLLSPQGVPIPSPSPSPSPSPATVTLQQSAGGTATLTTPGPYAVGQQIQASATPDAGMLLVGWQGIGFYTPTGAGPIGAAQGAGLRTFATAGTIGAWANPLTATVTNASVTLKPVFAAKPVFTDVATSDPAYEAITNLAARGVINGCFTDPATQAKDFCPTESTLRHQMAALIARAMPGWVDETGLPTFGDNTSDTELMTRVATLQRHNVVRGYQADVCQERGIASPPGCYGPLDTVKYGQVMLFIARAMVEKNYWTLQADDRTIFPDQNGAVGADPATDQQTKDHRMVVTYVHYVGAPPDVASANANFALANGQGWADPAPRAWFARAFWPALQSYFGANVAP